MKALRINCPHCEHLIDFLEEKIGQFIHCPRCALKVELNPSQSGISSAQESDSSLARHRSWLHYTGWVAVALLACGLVIWCVHQKQSTKSEVPANTFAAGETNRLRTWEKADGTGYSTNIGLTYLRVQKVDFNGVWGAVATFGFKNNGDKPVIGIKLTISLADTNAIVVQESTLVPFTDEINSPVLPGRSWETDPENPFNIPTVPDTWHEGSSFIKITDVQILK
jgi:hypothetical protein